MMESGDYIESLARDGKLQEARRAGEEALCADPHDESALIALVNVYLLIEKSCIENRVTSYLTAISQRLDELIPQLRDRSEAEFRHRQNNLLSCPGYNIIHELEDLSARDGHETEAYYKARTIYDKGEMDPKLHEIYGTIIYRYARVLITGNDSRPVRALLLDYLALNIPRPSRLHSLILRLAVRLARKFPEFGFTRFFQLWNPATLRGEDYARDDGKSSLAAISIELVLDSDQAFQLPQIMASFNTRPATVLSIVREAFVRLIARQIHSGDIDRAVALIKMYGQHKAIHDTDRFHLSLLSLALKTMRDNHAWEFPEFFTNWFNDSLLTESNYHLLTDAVNHCFMTIKCDKTRFEQLIARLIDIFDLIAELNHDGDDELNARQRALMMSWIERDNDAFKRMSAIASRQESQTPMFWLDFANIVNDSRLKAGILALGALRLGILDGRTPDEESAMIVRRLKQYLPDNDSTNTAAEPLPAYGVATMNPGEHIAHYELAYQRLAIEALAAIYNDKVSTPMSILEINNDTIIAASALHQPIVINLIEWPTLRELSPGNNIELKTMGGNIVLVRPIPNEKPYSTFKHIHGIVTDDGLVLHRHRPIAKHPPLPPVGEAVTALIYIDPFDQPVIHRLLPANKAEILNLFDSKVVTIFQTGKEDSHFTAGPNDIEGILHDSSLNVGDKLSVTYYQDPIRRTKVLNYKRMDDNTPCEATKCVSGKLSIGDNGNGTIRDTLVQAHIIDKSSISNGTYVTCKAIYNPKTLQWQALTIKGYD